MKNQSRSLWRRAVAILVMALLLFAVFPNAMAQGADPSDAVLAPVTEAPWLAHPGTTPEPADIIMACIRAHSIHIELGIEKRKEKKKCSSNNLQRL